MSTDSKESEKSASAGRHDSTENQDPKQPIASTSTSVSSRPSNPSAQTTSTNLVYSSPMGGPIYAALSRCTTTISPFRNDGRQIGNIGNVGLTNLKLQMDKAGKCVDESYRTALQSLMAVRYVELFFSSRRGAIPRSGDPQSSKLQEFVREWLTEVIEIHAKYSGLAQNIEKVIDNVESFRSESGSISSEDNISENRLKIIKYVKADMVRLQLTATPPATHVALENALSNIGIFCDDTNDLVLWWSGLGNELRNITQEKGDRFFSALKGALPRFHDYITPYVSQMRATVNASTGADFEYPLSRHLIDVTSFSIWKAPDPKSTTIIPAPQWTKFLNTTSFTLIAKEVSVDIGGHEVPHLVTARIMKIDEIERNVYGFLLRIVCRDPKGAQSESVGDKQEDGAEEDSASKMKYRCTFMDVSWTFDQSADKNVRPSIVDYAPTLSNSNAVEKKRGRKTTFKSPTSIFGVGLPTVARERTGEMSVPFYASAEAIPMESGCRWRITENQKLRRGVVDCDLGVVVSLNPLSTAMTSTSLKVNLRYETGWKDDVKFGGKMGLTRKRHGDHKTVVEGSTSIPLPVYSALGLIERATVSRDKYLEGCGLIASDKKVEKKP